MNKEYYIPSIEEFHVGFEYELNTEDAWETETWDFDIRYELDQPNYFIEESIEDGSIRVKYLDKEDIESLEFSNPQYFKEADYFGYTKDNIRLYLKPSHNGIILTKINKINGDEVLFNGNIKNKSELKHLLKQLGIDG